MSNPIKRRMTKAALVIAAGTAPVIAAGGSASALGLPETPDLGTLSGTDAVDGVSSTVGDTADTGTQLVEGAGSEVAQKAVPTTKRVAGTLAGQAVPLAHQTADKASGEAGALVDETASTLGDSNLTQSVGESLPTGATQLL